MFERSRIISFVCIGLINCGIVVAQPATNTSASARPPATAPSRVSAVTVYQGTALVTRDVDVPEGTGLLELVVTPLPPQSVQDSLYTEGTDGLRILSTRFRIRAVDQDTRTEVRDRENQIKKIQQDNEKIQKQAQVADLNLQFLAKLENFTSATLQTMTDKGWFNGDATVNLTKFIMTQRDTVSQSQVQFQQQVQANNEQIAFIQRQLSELASGSSRSVRDAVIIVDKANAPAAKVRLNYLVNAATWRPQYRLHAGTDKDPVQVEYLAAIEQQSGEDWTAVDVVLSNAQPMLNAAPPDLLALDITVGRRDVSQPNMPMSNSVYADNFNRSQVLRQRAQQGMNGSNMKEGGADLNDAAALDQTNELLITQQQQQDAQQQFQIKREGPSVTYHLQTKFTVPSRNDQQLIEIARIDLRPNFYNKAIPVLSPHVYRLAVMTNTSDYVLLPGEATMYLGKDFVGRMSLPLVAIGEEFTAGFGVDPQIQVDRQLATSTETVQGGNQVHTYTYRIRVSSFKTSPVALQLWDRLPKAESESVGVTLLSQSPDLSTDPQYVRSDRPKNLLRWDLTLKPGSNGESATSITYTFKLEYARDVSVGSFKATH